MWGGGTHFCPPQETRYREPFCAEDEHDSSLQCAYMSSTPMDSVYSDSSSSSLESYPHHGDWTVKKEPLSPDCTVKPSFSYPGGVYHGTFNDHHDSYDYYRRPSLSSSDCSDSPIEDDCSSAKFPHSGDQLYMSAVKQNPRRTSSRRRRGTASGTSILPKNVLTLKACIVVKPINVLYVFIVNFSLSFV